MIQEITKDDLPRERPITPLKTLFKEMHSSYQEQFLKRLDRMGAISKELVDMTPETVTVEQAYTLFGKATYRVALINQMARLLHDGLSRAYTPRTELHKLGEDSVRAAEVCMQLVESLIHRQEEKEVKHEEVSGASAG